METETNIRANRFQAAGDTLVPDPFRATAIDFQDFETWRKAPDVLEGNHGEVASPFSRDTDSAEQCGDLIAKTFPQIEAGI